MTTDEVLTHHLEAFGSGDVDAIMEDYAEDAVVMVPDDTHRGRDAIREMFVFLFDNVFIPDSYGFEMSRVTVDGEIAYIAWKADSERFEVPLGTDTFLIRDGKIGVQTFAAHIVFKR